MLFYIRLGLGEILWACVMQTLQGLFVALQMVINLESLVWAIERAQ